MIKPKIKLKYEGEYGPSIVKEFPVTKAKRLLRGSNWVLLKGEK